MASTWTFTLNLHQYNYIVLPVIIITAIIPADSCGWGWGEGGLYSSLPLMALKEPSLGLPADMLNVLKGPPGHSWSRPSELTEHWGESISLSLFNLFGFFWKLWDRQTYTHAKRQHFCVVVVVVFFLREHFHQLLYSTSGCNGLGLRQAKASSRELLPVLPCRYRGPSSWTIFCCLPQCISRELIWNRASKSQAGAHTGCQCHRQGLYLINHN